MHFVQKSQLRKFIVMICKIAGSHEKTFKSSHGRDAMTLLVHDSSFTSLRYLAGQLFLLS